MVSAVARGAARGRSWASTPTMTPAWPWPTPWLAVEAGAVHVQGTINGYGERCGNANLCTVIPNLELKMGYQGAGQRRPGAAHRGVSLCQPRSPTCCPTTTRPMWGRAPLPTRRGCTSAPCSRAPTATSICDPALVGNEMRVLVSELAGRGNIAHKLDELDLGVTLSAERDARTGPAASKSWRARASSSRAPRARSSCWCAAASPAITPPFEVLDFLVLVEKRSEQRHPGRGHRQGAGGRR